MNYVETEVNNWLATGAQDQNFSSDDVWEADFDVDRQIVYSKLGAYTKVFLRPEKFVKRFYHTVYPLPIEEWHCKEEIKLYDDFCTMDLTLDVRFQATLNYALNNIELLAELNEHIKDAYHGLVIDIVNRELLNLSDGSWVQEGLDAVEKRISLSISEMLVLQNIQSQVICKLRPSFEEFPDVKFAKESVYLGVLKKSFEFSEQQKEELFRQQQEQEKQKIEHKRQQLKQLSEIAELDLERQAIQAESNRQVLEEKEQQQRQQSEIKKRLHADKIKHNNLLKDMTLVVELEENEKQQERLRVSEEQEKIELISLHKKLKARELKAELEEYELEQASWREAKNKTHIEELDLKHRQRQLEFETDVSYKKRYEQKRLAMQEESFDFRKKADKYLKREIELLELEKKRVALELSIKKEKDEEKRRTNRDVE